MKVKEFIDQHTGTWQKSKLVQLLSQEGAQELLRIRLWGTRCY